jgi:hypothetical protein
MPDLKVATDTAPAVRGDFPAMAKATHDEMVGLSVEVQRDKDELLALARSYAAQSRAIKDDFARFVQEDLEDMRKLTRR